MTLSGRSEISWSSFRDVVKIAKDGWGIHLEDSKRALISTRLHRRMRILGIVDYDKYIDLVRSGNRAESSEFISAITTNVTGFNREAHHFNYLRDHMRLQLESSSSEPYRVWSAGCSSGQEVYSICSVGISLGDRFKVPSKFQVLGTDVDRSVLATAKVGEYSCESIKPLGGNICSRIFEPSSGDRCRAKDEIRNLVRFEEYNLMNSIPANWRFDAIFCRNVTIYFDQMTQQNLWKKMCSVLVPGGLLFIGHSERIDDHESFGLSTVGITAFQLNR